MKKLTLFSLLAILIFHFSVAQTKPTQRQSLFAAEELNKVLDKLYMAYNTKDSKLFVSLMADDGVYCGTDSREIWDKKEYAELMKAMFADTTFHSKITVDQRRIKYAKDGKSALVMDQFCFEWNKKIPVRHVVHLFKEGNSWICDFVSTSFIPNNEDMDKIFNVLK